MVSLWNKGAEGMAPLTWEMLLMGNLALLGFLEELFAHFHFEDISSVSYIYFVYSGTIF